MGSIPAGDMMITCLLYVGYEKSGNLTKPHNPSSLITERHTQDTHASCGPIVRLQHIQSVWPHFLVPTEEVSTTLNREISDRRRLTPLSLVVRVGKWVAVKYGSRRGAKSPRGSLPGKRRDSLALIAPRNAVRMDILVQVTDSKQTSSTN